MSARAKGAIASAIVGLVVGLVVAHAILLLDGCGGEPFTVGHASALTSDTDAGVELEASVTPEDDARPFDALLVDDAGQLEASRLEDARTLDAPDVGELEASTRDGGVDVEHDASPALDAPVEAPPPTCDPQTCAACATPWIRCCAAAGHCGCSLAGSVCQ